MSAIFPPTEGFAAAGQAWPAPLPWLSLMYAPAHDESRVDAARASGAHAVVLDLEDFVPAASKDRARRHIAPASRRLRDAGAAVVVRINQRMDLAVQDLDRSVIDGVNALMVCKTLGADHLRLLDETVLALEARRGLAEGAIRFIPLAETPASLDRLRDICTATPRVAAIGLGGEDIARAARMRAHARTLQHPKQAMVFHAAAAGIVPIGTLSSVADYGDAEAFAAIVRDSRDFGFQAATCLYAEQVAIVNRIYAPTADEVRDARRLLGALAQNGARRRVTQAPPASANDATGAADAQVPAYIVHDVADIQQAARVVACADFLARRA